MLKKSDEIDISTAITPAEPKRGPGRPKTKNLSQSPITNAKSGDCRQRTSHSIQTQSKAQDNPETINFKDKLTEKELNFLEIHISGNHNIEDSMKLAGYNNYSQSYLYKLGRKIIQKYERSAEDHRNIFRSVGLGEVAVAMGILRCCQTAKTDKDKREAWALAAKCLGLQREVIEGDAQGVTIIIGDTGQPAGTPAHGLQSKPIDITPAPKPLMIIK